MAHPYTSQTRMGAVVGTTLITALLDPDANGVAEITIATIIDAADAEVDARLRALYVVPFGAYSDTPGSNLCEPTITLISTHLAVGELFARSRPGSPDQIYHREKALDLIEGILKGDIALDPTLATEVEASERRKTVGYLATDPVFAGVDDDDAERMSGW